MHHHQACGRCGSADLLEVPTTPGDHSHIVLGDNLLHTVRVSKYVCTDCGCVEEWVNSAQDLKRLNEEYHRGYGYETGAGHPHAAAAPGQAAGVPRNPDGTRVGT